MSTTLTVTGMAYKHCEQRVAGTLTGADGVEDTTVDRGAKRATVEGDANTGALVVAVEDVGCNAST